jgi:membrane protein YdbS with pleckstrin-like domain
MIHPMNSRHRAVKVWLRGFVMFVVGAGLGLTSWIFVPWPWSLVMALGVAGLFFAMGVPGLLWVLRYRLKNGQR